jgi:hypothetical protein
MSFSDKVGDSITRYLLSQNKVMFEWWPELVIVIQSYCLSHLDMRVKSRKATFLNLLFSPHRPFLFNSTFYCLYPSFVVLNKTYLFRNRVFIAFLRRKPEGVYILSWTGQRNIIVPDGEYVNQPYTEPLSSDLLYYEF